MEEKKKKSGVRRVIYNNCYMIKLTYQACPWRVIANYLDTILRFGILEMFFNIIFLERIVKYIENNAPFSSVVKFLIFTVIFTAICRVFSIYYNNITAPAGNQIMYEKLHLKMFQKATDVELECFENPEFYNKYTKATSQIKGRAFGILNTTTSFITVIFNISFLTIKSITIPRHRSYSRW